MSSKWGEVDLEAGMSAREFVRGRGVPFIGWGGEVRGRGAVADGDGGQLQ
jgi:hypothetical protein